MSLTSKDIFDRVYAQAITAGDAAGIPRERIAEIVTMSIGLLAEEIASGNADALALFGVDKQQSK